MKKLWRRFAGYEKRFFLENEYHTLFVRIVLISGAIYLALSLLSLGRLAPSVFFQETEDAFMDFFNSIRDAAQGSAVYTERGVIYPPMANLIFQGLSFLLPEAYTDSLWEDRYTWVDYPSAVALIVVVTILCALLLGFLIYRSLKANRSKKWLLVLVGIGSVPVLNMLERGNIMVLAMTAVMIYALTYDSPRPLVRELGLIALAFSFSIKLYPILFAWILIGDKRYKEFFRCGLYSVLLLILPSFAFGGPECIVTMVENIIFFSMETKNPMQVVSEYTYLPYELVSGVAYLWFALCALHFAVTPFLYREKWRIWVIGSVALTAFPSLTSTYGWAIFLIPIAMMCNEGLKGKEHLRYLIPMTIPFLFIVAPQVGPLTGNAFAVYVALAFLSIYSLVDMGAHLKRALAARRQLVKQKTK